MISQGINEAKIGLSRKSTAKQTADGIMHPKAIDSVYNQSVAVLPHPQFDGVDRHFDMGEHRIVILDGKTPAAQAIEQNGRDDPNVA